MNSVELFAGSGGLALGIAHAGFCHKAVIELDKNACETIRENQRRGIKFVAGWPVFQADVTEFDFTAISGGVDLLAGGPPCQPFSLGGKHQGCLDERDMFPHFFRAVRELQPLAILIENVSGLLRPAFSKYFQSIILQLTYPEIVPKLGEGWANHLSRLELKAGVHGIPGGENMLASHTGQVRYFTVREAARLQTFPDEYFFPHCPTETMRQLGNAVPVALAEIIASSIRARIETFRAIGV